MPRPSRSKQAKAADVELVIARNADDLADRAARLFRDRVRARPDLAMAVPAGRTPRRMYERLRQAPDGSPADFARMHVFSVDELCPPAPADGYFWRQVRREFLAWAPVPPARLHPFAVGAPDLDAMCARYETTIAERGGLDLVMLGLGPNAHLASNEPGSPFDGRTRAVQLLADTVAYILTDDVIQGPVGDHAVTLGLGTILESREVVVPASVLRGHPRCLILADRDAAGD